MLCFPGIILLKLINISKKCYMIVRDKYYNHFLELCDIFNIDKNLIIKNNQNIIKINKLLILKILCHNGNYSYKGNPLVKIMSLCIKYIFNQNSNNLNESNDKIIFIRRQPLNKLNVGAHRYIFNFEDIKNTLEKYNIPIFEFENLTFLEKFNILSNSKLIFMEIGSSIVNLYYSNVNNSKIILFSNHANSTFHSLFRGDIEKINNITNYEIITCKMHNNLEIKPENINNPYIVDNNIIEKYILETMN